MINMHKFKIVKVDNGFCQITYATRNADNQRIFYCLQDNGLQGGIRLLRCTQEHEPSHEVTLKPEYINLFEIPTGDSELENKGRHWLEKWRKHEFRIG